MLRLFSPGYQWYRIFSSEKEAKDSIPVNKAVAVETGSVQVCLARTEKGFFAVRNNCPHQGGPLHQGHCENNAIVCPWHQYRFDLKSGKNITGIEEPITTYPVRIKKTGVSIGIPKK